MIATENRSRSWGAAQPGRRPRNRGAGGRVTAQVGAFESPGPNHRLRGIPLGWSRDVPLAVRRPRTDTDGALVSNCSRGRCRFAGPASARPSPTAPGCTWLHVAARGCTWLHVAASSLPDHGSARRQRRNSLARPMRPPASLVTTRPGLRRGFPLPGEDCSPPRVPHPALSCPGAGAGGYPETPGAAGPPRGACAEPAGGWPGAVRERPARAGVLAACRRVPGEMRGRGPGPARGQAAGVPAGGDPGREGSGGLLVERVSAEGCISSASSDGGRGPGLVGADAVTCCTGRPGGHSGPVWPPRAVGLSAPGARHSGRSKTGR
jgi:hypothetical protein